MSYYLFADLFVTLLVCLMCFVIRGGVQEYNGVRELTYKTFQFDSQTTPAIALGLFGFGWLCYHFMKKEAETRDEMIGLKREYGAAPKA